MILNPELDFYYGWRWLLPIAGEGEQVALFGMEEEQAEFWRRLEGITVVEGLDEATFLVGECFLPPPGEAGSNLEGFAVTGTLKHVRKWADWAQGRFSVKRCYALVEPANPRLVVSLEKPRYTREGLGLHRPGRSMARFLVRTLGYLAGIGISRPLKRRVLLIASKSYRAPWGAIDANIPFTSKRDCTLYLGTADENRKTVTLVHGDEWPFLVKSGQSRYAKKALRNEADALNALAETALAPYVPRVLDFVEKENRVSLHQQYRKRIRARAARMDDAIVDFLTKLSDIERKERSLTETLADDDIAKGMAWCRGHGIALALLDELDALAREGEIVLGHRSHGDFAPWNCAWTSEGLWVFDWEESRPWDVALADAFYYCLAPILHIRGKEASPETLRHMVFGFRARIARLSEIEPGKMKRDWALWLLRQAGSKPHALYGRLLKDLEVSWKEQSA